MGVMETESPRFERRLAPLGQERIFGHRLTVAESSGGS